jgi:hypothetical protein
MPTPDLHPEAAILMDRMIGPEPSDRSSVSEPIDPTQIDALALGDLWVVAQSVKSSAEGLAADTARSIIRLAEEMEPAFRGPACRDYLDLLAREAEEEPDKNSDISARFLRDKACFALVHCIDPSFDGLGVAAKRFLAAADWRHMPHLSVAIARLVDAESETEVLESLAADLAGSPLLVDELRAAARLDLAANIAVAHIAETRKYESLEKSPEIHHPLSVYPGYVAFAETALKHAAERLRKIHAFELPYASDKAFTLDESHIIARVTRIALDRDESWLPSVLDELFRKVSLAPTAAKSVPSQSVAIGLGHAIEAFPTPEAVATLRQVLRDIRHSGVEKKLQRNLRGAERGLAERPQIALRLLDQPVSKPQLTTLKHCLEASFALRVTLTYDDWSLRLAKHEQAKKLTGSLVWRILDTGGGSTAVLPVTERGHLKLQDVAGAMITATPESRVTLWHPLDATSDERAAWGERLAELKIKQPFKQISREHYVVPSDELSDTKTMMFSDRVVSIVPFLGLARRESWRLDYDDLIRTFGQWTAKLDLADHIYPGSFGTTTILNLSTWTSIGKRLQPVRLGEVPQVTLSEILRAVDLLVSVGGSRDGGE